MILLYIKPNKRLCNRLVILHVWAEHLNSKETVMIEELEDHILSIISCKYQWGPAGVQVIRSIWILFLQRINESRSILQDHWKMSSIFHPLEVGLWSAVGRAWLADDLLNPNEICRHGRLVPTRSLIPASAKQPSPFYPTDSSSQYNIFIWI